MRQTLRHNEAKELNCQLKGIDARGDSKMPIKKEVKELCLKMLNSKINSKEWNEAKDELIKKWKFTPFNLLALYSSTPTIEFNDENMHLVLE
jgi:hypothetical protein